MDDTRLVFQEVYSKYCSTREKIFLPFAKLLLGQFQVIRLVYIRGAIRVSGEEVTDVWRSQVMHGHTDYYFRFISDKLLNCFKSQPINK